MLFARLQTCRRRRAGGRTLFRVSLAVVFVDRRAGGNKYASGRKTPRGIFLPSPRRNSAVCAMYFTRNRVLIEPSTWESVYSAAGYRAILGSRDIIYYAILFRPPFARARARSRIRPRLLSIMKLIYLAHSPKCSPDESRLNFVLCANA